jgi:hypothetical protein
LFWITDVSRYEEYKQKTNIREVANDNTYPGEKRQRANQSLTNNSRQRLK